MIVLRICTGSTTNTTARISVPAFRHAIFMPTSRISPIPRGRSCGALTGLAF